MLHHDRWIEMDLIWFDPQQDRVSQIDRLLARLAPLWRSTDGMRGLCLNVGWLIDLLTEWTGRADQRLPLRSRRTAAWAQRTYADLRDLLAVIRERAARAGLPDLRLGILCVGWAYVVWPPDLKIYDFDSDWYGRHPELYGGPTTIIGMPDLWPINRLHADNYSYAAYPDGLVEGTCFPDFFGAQWGSLASFLGVDALHLRDGMTGPLVYTRSGPYGPSAPADPEVWRTWTQAAIDLYRAIKTARPSTFLIGYSSAISPTAEWRVGCIDLEALVADGAIDAWVDQTWGGAWQDWWYQLWKGWTFQLANLMIHRVQIEAANRRRAVPCRHLNLIETWDGWEPWDTLHQVPNKLRWGIWAFNHAAAITPEGPRPTDGSYISWANHRSGKLLSENDVAFLSTHLDAAQASAAQLERVHGPIMVYNRPVLQWLMDNHPDWNASEWIEDQVGLLMKWGLPCLGATRVEWLPAVIEQADALIAQLPGQLDPAARDVLLNPPCPVLCTGRADLIDPQILARCGACLSGALQPEGFYPLSLPVWPGEIVHLPTFQPVSGTFAVLPTDQGPLATNNREAGSTFIYWQPPDWAEPANAQLPKSQLGSTLPYAQIADWLAAVLPVRARGTAYELIAPLPIRLRGNDWQSPTACQIWQSNGTVHVLVGNLETGYLGDSRTVRHVTLEIDTSDSRRAVLRRIDALAEPEKILARESSGVLAFDLVLLSEQAQTYCLEYPS
ncbi:MAG TPA: hypothetical protein VMT34_18310 [Aggregatilineales bacterium]|nr:hypothetical protein [Aggregatilineales bacterium]